MSLELLASFTRSPGSARLHFFDGGFPYKDRLQTKVGTLVLTSLLEDLVYAWNTWPGTGRRNPGVCVPLSKVGA